MRVREWQYAYWPIPSASYAHLRTLHSLRWRHPARRALSRRLKWYAAVPPFLGVCLAPRVLRTDRALVRLCAAPLSSPHTTSSVVVVGSSATFRRRCAPPSFALPRPTVAVCRTCMVRIGHAAPVRRGPGGGVRGGGGGPGSPPPPPLPGAAARSTHS